MMLKLLLLLLLLLLYRNLRAVGFSYDQTRDLDKPLLAAVCFSIEHARVRHAPSDTFDVNFICQF